MDQAHEWTDEQIEALQRRFDRAYSQAAKEMREKLDKFLLDYAKRNSKWMKDIHDGKATREDWEEWKRGVATSRQFMAGMVETLANDATRTNQLAFDMINDTLPSVAAENANFAAYGIESRLGYDTHSFDLVDQSTVRRMMGLGDDGQILHEVIPQGEVPNVPWQSVRVNMDTAKDVRWNRQKFNAALTQSILQGESIPNTAKRLSTVLNMDKNMATRAARTAMTGAENAGRTDSYARAKRIGIELEQEWMATLDERTRISHRQLDGTHVPVGEKFQNGLEFPGDPKGAGEEIWNCRCTLVAWFPDIEQEDPARWSRLPDGITYEQWKSVKREEANAVESGTATRYTNMSNPLWRQIGVWAELSGTSRESVANKVDELLSSSHGKARQLWAKMEQHLKMADPFETDGAYFSPGDGVHMNLQRSLDNTGNRGTLSTWFHEFGHHIDNAVARASGRYGYASTENDNYFGETLRKEVDDYIKSVQRADNSLLRSLKNSRDMQGLLEKGFIERWNSGTVRDYYDTLEHLNDEEWLRSQGYFFLIRTPEEGRRDKVWSVFLDWAGVPQRTVPIQKVREKVGREITDSGRDVQLAVGDIFEGATRGRCQDTFGHGSNYWDSGNRSLSEEAFAEFYSAECIYSERPEILDAMIERLPKSYAAYQEIVEGMLNA